MNEIVDLIDELSIFRNKLAKKVWIYILFFIIMTFNLRKLQPDDYDKGFFECLAYLTKSPKIPFE